jgi:hypothetical protein
LKYTTFRALLIGGAVVIGGGGLFAACMSCEGGTKSDPTAVAKSEPTTDSNPGRTPVQQSTAPATPGPTDPKTPADPSALRPMDQKLLDKVHAGFPGDKVKDAFKGESYKVNLYNEGGKIRAKVDFDRDEKWDEKWDFEKDGDQEVVKRHVSTNDDDKYDVEYRLREGKWVKK